MLCIFIYKRGHEFDIEKEWGMGKEVEGQEGGVSLYITLHINEIKQNTCGPNPEDTKARTCLGLAGQPV